MKLAPRSAAGSSITVPNLAMKRAKNLWPSITSFSNLLLAAKKAQRCKRFKPNVAEFNYNLETELLLLQQQLTQQTYRPGPYTVFKIIDPKPRYISAAPYRDRVVHHALCNLITPIFEKTFITDSYANRQNFGTHKALRRFTQFSRASTYVLQCYISKYFPNIDHIILKQLLQQKLKCPQTLWLIDLIIENSNPQETVNIYFPGDQLFTPLERRKGLPLGNLTSQFFANIYLNALDHYVKDTLRFRKYLRYVDDFALFSDSKSDLKQARHHIEIYLTSLRLILHPTKTQILNTVYGGQFVGFRVFPQQIRVAPKNIRRGRKRLRLLIKRVKNERITPKDLQQAVHAWRGHLKHGDTHRLQQQLFGSLPFAA